MFVASFASLFIWLLYKSWGMQFTRELKFSGKYVLLFYTENMLTTICIRWSPSDIFWRSVFIDPYTFLPGKVIICSLLYLRKVTISSYLFNLGKFNCRLIFCFKNVEEIKTLLQLENRFLISKFWHILDKKNKWYWKYLCYILRAYLKVWIHVKEYYQNGGHVARFCVRCLLKQWSADGVSSMMTCKLN